ncbi:hypothetical protein NQ318_021639 [Aromia moschata]|uniref:Reverse transcriptase domain-containing protein n=1 Tax=Aromia moschata TaxID=1265417 RepID=A0AAV8X703_9CUCU|nr:hypothetical protein NQ318_021639 [Aromia moschata]
MYDMILTTDWSFLKSSIDVNDACDNIKEIIHHGIQLKSFKISERKIQLIRTINDITQICTMNNLNLTPKFWSFVQSKRSTSRIPGTVFYNDQTIRTPQSVVNGFSNYFSDVYLLSDPSYKEQDVLINNIHVQINSISENDIIQASKKLKNKMTSGIDNVPSFVVKDCISAFAMPLCIIFNLILKTKQYPSIWKTTKICPVLKTGDPSLITNYRPIAILCNFGKLLEIIIYDNIYSSIKCIISPSQHGFLQEKSTTTNLVCITQYIAEALDCHGQVDVIYTDIQKAFDQIDHFLLLSKLSNIGFSFNILTLMESYLLGRRQFVEYGGCRSTSYLVYTLAVRKELYGMTY